MLWMEPPAQVAGPGGRAYGLVIPLPHRMWRRPRFASSGLRRLPQNGLSAAPPRRPRRT